MKKLSLLLAVVLMLSCLAPALAEQQYFNGATTQELVDPSTFNKPYSFYRTDVGSWHA